MPHNECRRQAGHVDLTELPIAGAQLRKRYSDRIALHRPRLRSASDSAAIPRIVVPGVLLPVRIIVLVLQPPPENGHQSRKAWMNSGAMQTLVVVFPEDLPIAGDRLLKAVADDEFLQVPAIQSIQGLIEGRAEGRWMLSQRDKHAAIPCGDRDCVEVIILAPE